MQSKLLTVVAILGLGIGCDDPEVQGKVAAALEHGSVVAELKCSFSHAHTFPFTPSSIPVGKYKYDAYKFLDGSCHVQICTSQGSVSEYGSSTYYCQTSILARSNAAATLCRGYQEREMSDESSTSGYPHRYSVDGLYAYVEDGLLTFESRDNYYTKPGANCGGGSNTCADPLHWFDYDITDPGCTGRNLEAFGAE